MEKITKIIVSEVLQVLPVITLLMPLLMPLLKVFTPTNKVIGLEDYGRRIRARLKLSFEFIIFFIIITMILGSYDKLISKIRNKIPGSLHDIKDLGYIYLSFGIIILILCIIFYMYIKEKKVTKDTDEYQKKFIFKNVRVGFYISIGFTSIGIATVFQELEVVILCSVVLLIFGILILFSYEADRALLFYKMGDVKIYIYRALDEDKLLCGKEINALSCKSYIIKNKSYIMKNVLYIVDKEESEENENIIRECIKDKKSFIISLMIAAVLIFIILFYKAKLVQRIILGFCAILSIIICVIKKCISFTKKKREKGNNIIHIIVVILIILGSILWLSLRDRVYKLEILLHFVVLVLGITYLVDNIKHIIKKNNCDNFLKSFNPYLLIQNFIAYYQNRNIRKAIVMKRIENEVLTGERALFQENGLEIEDTIFADGESALKHGENINAVNTMYKWKYPFWYAKNVNVKDSTFFEMARSGLWYGENITIEDTMIEAPKEFRRCDGVNLKNVSLPNASETFWMCKNIRLENVVAKGTYFGLNSENVYLDRLNLYGDYCFDGGKNIEVHNCKLLSKDSFWNTENVVIYDSFIVGEYFGWNSNNITLINCTVESLQGFCYIENLVMKNCKLVNTALAFEFSTVDVEVISKIDSVFNPKSGVIKAKEIGTLIIDNENINPEDTKIIVEGEVPKPVTLAEVELVSGEGKETEIRRRG